MGALPVNSGVLKFPWGPARVWTIEYQKQGLPHLHLLVFLEDSDHFLEPEVIDEMVCGWVYI